MKVLHVIPSLSMAHGGPSRAIRSMERSLTACGIGVTVATTDDDGRHKRIRRPSGQVINEEGAARIYFCKVADPYTLAIGLTGWLWRNIRRYDVCHVHALFSFASTVASLVALGRGVPLVVRPLGTLNDYGVKQRRPMLKRVSLALLERPILRRAAAVHCTSADEATDVRKVQPLARTVVVPLAVEPLQELSRNAAVEMFPELADRRIVLFLSRLDPKKNVEVLLDAWAVLASPVPRALLVVAGSGDEAYVASLKERAQRLGIENDVLWPGYVDGLKKSALLRLACVFVLPSFSENFGIAAAEALAAGLPCIVSPGVALANDIAAAAAGEVVEPNASTLASAMRKYLDDEELCQLQGERARELASTAFSEAILGQRLFDLYRSLPVAAKR